jgi:formylglycine-generating enzyme required for sulfatase activity/dienelactone hydrolase
MNLPSLVGHYRITAKIGAGGMGEVYRATDTKLGRDVALKVLPADMARDPDRLARFQREAHAVAALNHPHIVTVFSVEEADGVHFLTMELVEGESLDHLIPGSGLPVERVVEIAMSLAEALSAAHEKGIVHRDLKPANFMVTGDGHVKVLDFGLAKEMRATDPADTTMTLAGQSALGAVIGTPAYMSPEQAQGRTVDRRTDIFSLGAVLYEMLTGRRAFNGHTTVEVLAAVSLEEPKNLHDLRPNLPRKLESIVRKALAKKPEDRYQRIEELRSELDQVRQQLAPRPGRRRLIAACLLAVLAAAAGMIYLRRTARISQAHELALPEIRRLAGKGDFVAALRLAEDTERIIPGAPQLTLLLSEISVKASIQSIPAGANVEMKEYTDPNNAWISLGKTPVEQVRIPRGYFRWRLSKPGFTPAEGAFEATAAPPNLTFSLDPEGSIPTGMVRVPGSQFSLNITEVGGLGPYRIEKFLIDRFEVTNREFKQFVDEGGYSKREYWKHPLVEGSRTLTWEEAADRFHDTTGRPGPSNWEGGRYQDGREDYPVTGVSWYEAAAYAEFVHKSLPTLAHWYKAADVRASPYIVPRSNFGGQALARVGEYKGLGTYGTYDMAGNAKEWCWNESVSGQHFVLGGAWSEPAHMFTNNSDTRSAFDRSPVIGFRCVRYSGSIQPALLAPMPRSGRDYSKAKPVSEEVYRAYLNLFTYDRTDPAAILEAGEETADWKKEKVSVAGAYGGERVPMYIFTPKNTRPPYQTVIYFTGAGAARLTSSDTLLGGLLYGTMIRSGRAVVYPVFWGTYERHSQRALQRTLAARRERTLNWARDLNRVTDYIETRPDLDKTRIAYLGSSQGAWVAPVLAAAEPRIKTLILLSGGLPLDMYPPEVDTINFAPRVKRPVLMINGRYDFTFPYEASQLPLFRLLGIPEKDKRHMVYEAGHDVFSIKSAEIVGEMLGWLDKYLGRVR